MQLSSLETGPYTLNVLSQRHETPKKETCYELQEISVDLRLSPLSRGMSPSDPPKLQLCLPLPLPLSLSLSLSPFATETLFMDHYPHVPPSVERLLVNLCFFRPLSPQSWCDLFLFGGASPSHVVGFRDICSGAWRESWHLQESM